MNSPAAPPLFDHTAINTETTRTSINPTLWCDDCDGYRVIFCRHAVLYRVALVDTQHLMLVAVTLRQSELVTQKEIAAAFGHSEATQRRWEMLYRQHGSAGLLPKKPTGRHAALDGSQCACVTHWFGQGVSNAAMARRLAVSETTIRRVLRAAGLRRPPKPAGALFADAVAAPAVPAPGAEPARGAVATPVALTAAALALVPVAAPVLPTVPAVPADATTVTATPTVTTAAGLPVTPVTPVLLLGYTPTPTFTLDHDPCDRAGDRCLARLGLLDDAAPLFADHAELPRAGVLLAIPALLAHGGLAVFQRLYGSIGPAFYGLRTTVLSLVLLALLRIKRPENIKEFSPEQLGQLVGLDRMAEVKTLRRKLTQLAERHQGRALMQELARLRLAQDEARFAFLYVDGHVREYSGQEALAKTKKAQRAVATCAATDTWLHDADGVPLLVVTSEMNAGLSHMLEPIVREAQQLVPAGQRLTVLFDRGGWRAKLFARLSARGVDGIT
jgi:hypothetical protein